MSVLKDFVGKLFGFDDDLCVQERVLTDLKVRLKSAETSVLYWKGCSGQRMKDLLKAESEGERWRINHDALVNENAVLQKTLSAVREENASHVEELRVLRQAVESPSAEVESLRERLEEFKASECGAMEREAKWKERCEEAEKSLAEKDEALRKSRGKVGSLSARVKSLEARLAASAKEEE